ncbi:MAG: hypothetical protein ACUVX9_05065 [Anaerolineae bacterium]
MPKRRPHACRLARRKPAPESLAYARRHMRACEAVCGRLYPGQPGDDRRGRGVSQYIGEMSRSELREHIEQVFRVGAEGGGFIASSEGSIPINMTHENLAYYLQLRRELAMHYGRRRPSS